MTSQRPLQTIKPRSQWLNGAMCTVGVGLSIGSTRITTLGCWLPKAHGRGGAMSDQMFFTYRGVPVHQNGYVGDVFRALFRTFKPVKVLEIGTADGGLTILLRDLLDEAGLKATDLWTCDPIVRDRPHLIHPGIMYYAVDALNSSVLEYHVKYAEGPALVLCDGGNKVAEFNHYAKFLRSGDVIMAHDYAPDHHYFKNVMQNQRWNWWEIQHSEIVESCLRYELDEFMQEEFQRVAWACRRKA